MWLLWIFAPTPALWRSPAIPKNDGHEGQDGREDGSAVLSCPFCPSCPAVLDPSLPSKDNDAALEARHCAKANRLGGPAKPSFLVGSLTLRALIAPRALVG
jgi:hypothetical protein